MSIDIDGMETLAMHRAYVSPDAIIALIARLREAETREQALAAYVEQQGDLLADSASWLDHAKVFISTRQKMHEAGREGVEECLLRIAESRSNAPAASLTRRDLIKQAEVSWHEPTIRRIREMCDGLTGNQIRHALDGMLESTPTSRGR